MASVYGGGKRSDFYGERKVLGEGKVPKLEKVEVMPMFLLSLFSSSSLALHQATLRVGSGEKTSRPGERGTISERFEELTSSRFPLSHSLKRKSTSIFGVLHSLELFCIQFFVRSLFVYCYLCMNARETWKTKAIVAHMSENLSP